ncbi:hypothetical protein ACFX15_027773 [Malus domestica]
MLYYTTYANAKIGQARAFLLLLIDGWPSLPPKAMPFLRQVRIREVNISHRSSKVAHSKDPFYKGDETRHLFIKSYKDGTLYKQYLLDRASGIPLSRGPHKQYLGRRESD